MGGEQRLDLMRADSWRSMDGDDDSTASYCRSCYRTHITPAIASSCIRRASISPLPVHSAGPVVALGHGDEVDDRTGCSGGWLKANHLKVLLRMIYRLPEKSWAMIDRVSF